MSITLQELAIYLCWGFTDLATIWVLLKPTWLSCTVFILTLSKELIFTLSKTAITKYFGVTFTGYDPTDANKLAKTGYKYESLSPTEALHWADIKDGALYLTEKGLFRKHGLDSYEQEVI